MCLDSIANKIDKPSTLIQSGWKEFSNGGWRSDKLSFQSYSFNGSKTVPLDKWITAEGDKIQGPMDYKPGFHIYEDEQQLTTNTRKRRVYYRNVHTRGSQSNRTVVIAQEMYVPSDPDAWPPKA